MKIQIYDTTLRDGEQGKGINFTVADKIKISKILDDFGCDYIEGGWPGSNPKTIEFFQAMQNVKFKHAKMAAFGSTRRAKLKSEEDPNLKAIIDSKVPVATIFGKSWDLHVTDALCVPLETNLEMIFDSVKFLKDNPQHFNNFKSEYGLDPSTSFDAAVKKVGSYQVAKYVGEKKLMDRGGRFNYVQFVKVPTYTDNMVEPMPGKEVYPIGQELYVKEKGVESLEQKEKVRQLTSALAEVASEAGMSTLNIPRDNEDINVFNR